MHPHDSQKPNGNEKNDQSADQFLARFRRLFRVIAEILTGAGESAYHSAAIVSVILLVVTMVAGSIPAAPIVLAILVPAVVIAAIVGGVRSYLIFREKNEKMASAQRRSPEDLLHEYDESVERLALDDALNFQSVRLQATRDALRSQLDRLLELEQKAELDNKQELSMKDRPRPTEIKTEDEDKILEEQILSDFSRLEEATSSSLRITQLLNFPEGSHCALRLTRATPPIPVTPSTPASSPVLAPAVPARSTSVSVSSLTPSLSSPSSSGSSPDLSTVTEPEKEPNNTSAWRPRARSF